LLSQSPGPNTGRGADQSIIRAKLPILNGDIPQDRVEQAKRLPLLVAAVIAKRCAKYLFESGHQDAAPYLQMNAAIEAAVAIDNIGGPIEQTINAKLEETTAKINEINTQAAAALKDLEEFRFGTQKTIDNSISSVTQAIDKLAIQEKEQNENETKRKTRWETEKTAALQSIRDEVTEFTKIQASINLWRTKARWHTLNYIALGFIFGASLVAVAYVMVFGYISNFITELTKIPADHQFLGIALLTIPTLAVAWLLRFIARLALQNLSLAHDARQRHAQVNTYLRLLGDPSKPISENERILALAALFRPLPGQGPDDVNPPTIAELLKEASEHVTKPRR
jgi:hypothetical protein